MRVWCDYRIIGRLAIIESTIVCILLLIAEIRDKLARKWGRRTTHKLATGAERSWRSGWRAAR